MVICGSTFVPLAPFLENDVRNFNQTKQEQKDMITLGTHLIYVRNFNQTKQEQKDMITLGTHLILGPNKLKRKRGSLHA